MSFQDEFSDPVKLLRTLKGAPLSVLLACVYAGGRVRADWIVTVTGYTDKPVTSALNLLTAYGWIAKYSNGWQVASGVQLPLMLSNSELFRSSSCSSNTNVLLSTIEQEQQGRNNSDFLRNFQVLKNCGIREPACSRLAALEHVTPDFILAHVREVTRIHGNLGTAIHRIENNWAAPEVVEVKQASSHRYSEGAFATLLNDEVEE